MEWSKQNTPLQTRSAVLRKLGITEDDVTTSEKLFAQMPPPPPLNTKFTSKTERILGYSLSRIKREKALRLMGASEEEVDLENAKNLGTLGCGGRRRSFCIVEVSNRKCSRRLSLDISLMKRRRSTRYETRPRRKSSSDLMRMKKTDKYCLSRLLVMQKQAVVTNQEVMRLKERVAMLEREIKLKNEEKKI